jgi:hypothetical protein
MVGRRSVETVPESFHIKARVSQNTEFNPSWEVGLVDVDRDCGRRDSRVRGQLPVPTLDTASPADHPRFSLRSFGKMFCPCMPPNWCGTMCLCLGAVRPARSAMGSGVDRTSRGRLPGAENPTQQPFCPIAVPRSHLRVEEKCPWLRTERVQVRRRRIRSVCRRPRVAQRTCKNLGTLAGGSEWIDDRPIVDLRIHMHAPNRKLGPAHGGAQRVLKDAGHPLAAVQVRTA